MPKPEPLLWLSDARGVFIPRDFAASFADREKHVSGVDAEQWGVLDAGPEHEFYWDVWQEVCDDGRVTDNNGQVFRVYQDGDCWLVPAGMEWSDKANFFVWPEDEE